MSKGEQETLTSFVLGLYRKASSSLDLSCGIGDGEKVGNEASEIRIVAAKIRTLCIELEQLLCIEDEAYPAGTESHIRVIERELSALTSRMNSLVNQAGKYRGVAL